MNLSIDIDRTDAALHAYSAFTSASSNVSSLKGTLNLTLDQRLSADASHASLSISSDIFSLVEQWLETLLAFLGGSTSQHTIFCDTGGIVLELRGSNVCITFDSSLCMSQFHEPSGEERKELRIPVQRLASATHSGVASFCAQLTAINPALEHFHPVQAIMRLNRQLREKIESRRGVYSLIDLVRSHTSVQFKSAWSYAAWVVLPILVMQIYGLNARIKQLQSQQVSSGAARESVRDTRRALMSKNRIAMKGMPEQPPRTQAEPVIGIPFANGQRRIATAPGSARANARMAPTLNPGNNDSQISPFPAPLPAPLASRMPGANPVDGLQAKDDTRHEWKLVGIIEFEGERTAVMERKGRDYREDTVVYKKVHEAVDAGWTIDEIQSHHVILVRKKAVAQKRSAAGKPKAQESIERRTLTIGQ